MSTIDGDPGDTELLAALERFVVENDELLELEERIGRFNIFDALGIARAEIRHSNYLAWLLDPAESHGQGGLFLKAVLMDLLKRAGEEGLPRALSPVQLDGMALRGVEVHREWRHIDLLITCREPAFVVAIENKIDTSEHGSQLKRYADITRERFPKTSHQFVFLTREGDPPEKEEDAALWVPYSYADLYRVLTRVRKSNVGSIGDDVETFLDHYLNLIGSRFMDDPQIDELCQTIYKNHRQALELIFERISPSGTLLNDIAEFIEQSQDWNILHRTSKQVRFAPAVWPDQMLPPVSAWRTMRPDRWLYFGVGVKGHRCTLFCMVTRTHDSAIRQQVIERLTRDPAEFGLKTFFKDVTHAGKRSTKLSTETIARWQENESPEPEKVRKALEAKLEQHAQHAEAIAEAVRPITDKWQRENADAPPR